MYVRFTSANSTPTRSRPMANRLHSRFSMSHTTPTSVAHTISTPTSTMTASSTTLKNVGAVSHASSPLQTSKAQTSSTLSSGCSTRSSTTRQEWAVTSISTSVRCLRISSRMERSSTRTDSRLRATHTLMKRQPGDAYLQPSTLYTLSTTTTTAASNRMLASMDSAARRRQTSLPTRITSRQSTDA